jgi:hypothetical protein
MAVDIFDSHFTERKARKRKILATFMPLGYRHAHFVIVVLERGALVSLLGWFPVVRAFHH